MDIDYPMPVQGYDFDEAETTLAQDYNRRMADLRNRASLHEGMLTTFNDAWNHYAESENLQLPETLLDRRVLPENGELQDMYQHVIKARNYPYNTNPLLDTEINLDTEGLRLHEETEETTDPIGTMKNLAMQTKRLLYPGSGDYLGTLAVPQEHYDTAKATREIHQVGELPRNPEWVAEVHTTMMDY